MTPYLPAESAGAGDRLLKSSWTSNGAGLLGSIVLPLAIWQLIMATSLQQSQVGDSWCRTMRQPGKPRAKGARMPTTTVIRAPC